MLFQVERSQKRFSAPPRRSMAQVLKVPFWVQSNQRWDWVKVCNFTGLGLIVVTGGTAAAALGVVGLSCGIAYYVNQTSLIIMQRFLKLCSIGLGLVSVVLIFSKFYLKLEIPNWAYVTAFILAGGSIVCASLISKKT